MKRDFDLVTIFAAALASCLGSCLGAVILALGWMPVGEAIISTGRFLHSIA